MTWHHLVMSVGNFKRQGGSISLLELPSSLEPTGLDGDPLEECNVLVRSRISGVTSAIRLSADDPMTWRLLDQVDGLAVATSTTLLSALWPGRHFVIDVRDLNAAIALDYVEAQAMGVNPGSQRNVMTTWEWYAWLRDKLFLKTLELKAADRYSTDALDRASSTRWKHYHQEQYIPNWCNLDFIVWGLMMTSIEGH